MALPITPDLYVGDLIDSGEYAPLSDYFFTHLDDRMRDRTLGWYGFERVGFQKGLDRAKELLESGQQVIYDVYTDEERQEEPDREEAKVLYFPVAEKDRPYAVILSGGGLNRQWGLVEGFPVAARLNELGIPTFLLYYRTQQRPVIDKSIADTRRGMQWIHDHAEELHVKQGHYMIGGFSAGALVAGLFGTKEHGYTHTTVPKPELMVQAYTTSLLRDYVVLAKVVGSARDFLERIGGVDYKWSTVKPYRLVSLVDADYPPTYFTANRDDTTVPVLNTLKMERKLRRLGVPTKLKLGRRGGHSFGLGIGMDVDGWLDEAVRFWNELAGEEA